MISFKPDIICVDFETADSRGASLQYWRDDFRVLSASATWRKSDGEFKSIFRKGEAATEAMLAKFINDGVPIVAHNAAFEVGCLLARFPKIDPSIIKYDTMRMVQTFDSGGRRYGSSKDHRLKTHEEADTDHDSDIGLGLEVSAKRLLPETYHSHKAPFHAYLRDNHGVKAGQEGKHLHLLPEDMLAAYNCADTEVTLALYLMMVDHFKAYGYDMSLDQELHMSAVLRICKSQLHGVKVDRTALDSFYRGTLQEQDTIVKNFKAAANESIKAIEAQRLEEWVSIPKTDKGRQNRIAKAEECRKEWEFNPRSTQQLKHLLVDQLKHEVLFWTKPGKGVDKTKFEPKPSFRAAHLPSYGNLGVILQKLKKRQLVSNQAKSLLTLSEYDDRWHNGLRAVGTRTGRYTGSSAGDAALNIQALSRKEKGFMSVLQADPGKTFVSCDLTAGEPTIACHYSGDVNYRMFCFDMVGRAPFYRDGLLHIDDIYLGVASKSPTGRAKVKELFHTTFGGLSFAEQWLKDSELIKSEAKSFRQAHKVFTLALMYGSGAQGLVSTAYDHGFILSRNDSRDLSDAFWYDLFSELRLLRDNLTRLVEREGSLTNEFGFRMTPEKSNLALNYYIQSSVSGLIKCVEMLVLQAAPWARWVTNIHDETIWEIEEARVPLFRSAVEQAILEINRQLEWSIPIRAGFVVGKDLYTAK